MKKIILTLLAILACATTAQAAEFYLVDGSVIVGTIISLADGEDLVVDTEHMGDVTIEWEAVDRIRGTQVVDVEFFDGRRLFGTIQFGEDGVTIAGDKTTRVQAGDVFSISEVNETFWEALEVYTDLGMNLVRGNNTVTQVSIGAGIGYDAPSFETSIDGRAIFNEQIETQDTRRFTVSADYTQKFNRGWSATGLFQFESDEQQNLDGRSLLGGAIGKRVVNRHDHRFELFSGLALNSENFSDTARTDTLEGIVGTTYRLRSKVDIDATLILFPSLEENRYRAQFDSTLTVDLIADLDFKVIVYNRYDSEPPAGNVNSDSGLTLGLSWDY